MISQEMSHEQHLPNFTLSCSPSVTESFASHNENLDRNKEKVLNTIGGLKGNLSFLYRAMFK